jgi:hypothetical protein
MLSAIQGSSLAEKAIHEITPTGPSLFVRLRVISWIAFDPHRYHAPAGDNG